MNLNEWETDKTWIKSSLTRKTIFSGTVMLNKEKCHWAKGQHSLALDSGYVGLGCEDLLRTPTIACLKVTSMAFELLFVVNVMYLNFVRALSAIYVARCQVTGCKEFY